MKKTLKSRLMFSTLSITFAFNLGLLFFVNDILFSNIKNNIKLEMESYKKVIATDMKKNKDKQLNDIDTYIWKTLYENNLRISGYIGFYDESFNEVSFKGTKIKLESINKLLSESNNKKSIIYYDKSQTMVATYVYPIYIAREFKANLIIQSPYYKEFVDYKQTVGEFAIVQFILFVIIVTVLNSIINRIVNPLKALRANIKSFGEGNEVDNIIVHSTDEISEVATAFNEMKEERMRLQNVSREFFNNATHELKTPVTSIYSYAQILHENKLEDLDKDFRDRAISRISLECIKLKDLVQKLLDISRGSVVKNKIIENINLKEIIEDIIDSLEIRCTRSNKKITSYLDDITTTACKQDVEQIILNLLDNAIKYSSKENIDVFLQETQEHEKILIIENSIGLIPDKFKEILLEPFVKYNNFSNTQSEEISSSGLGLYLCSQLCEENNIKFEYNIILGKIVFKCTLK